jgi:outer membrane lipoprotein-sorting protein
MRRLLTLVGTATLLAGAPLSGTAGGGDPQAAVALRRTEDLLRSGSSIATYRMTVTRPDWTRDMRFLSHDDRPRERFQMEILEPRKTQGTLFFKVGNQLSMYLPKLERRIAISPVMMQDPWMGSDFNNQDLLEASSVLTSYDHRVIAREGTGPGEVLTIESEPKAGVPVVWGRLRQRVRADGIPLSVDYLNPAGDALRRMEFDQVREMGDRTIPTRWTMTPLDKPGHRTEIVLESIRFDARIPESVFAVPPGQ